MKKLQKKRSKIKIASLGLLIILLVISSWYLINHFSYAKKLPYYSINTTKDSIITVGVIGDSWVEKEKIDSIIHEFLLSDSINSKVLSAGHSGARSKFIYQNLFKDKNEDHSSKFIIESQPDYGIVIAGVNDATGQMGPGYYSYHIIQIIKTLLHYKIKPLIISLPEFGIEKTPPDMKALKAFFWKFRNKVFAIFNNHGEVDNIKTYRKCLLKKLDTENLKDSVTIIDFDNVCSDYSKCPLLYADRGHLSVEGKLKMCHLITDELIKAIKTGNILQKQKKNEP